MSEESLDRAKVLLKAAHDILRKCDESPYVLNVLEVTSVWDGVDCDGYCLGTDIEHYFMFDEGEPIDCYFEPSYGSE